MGSKVGIVVPYRNRYEQLLMFKTAVSEYLSSKDISFELIIVEQDDAKLFNRGKLLNVGFKEAKKLKCTYVVFHDIDMIPLEVDYSFSEVPLLLATQRRSFDEFFSSVILFPIEYFEKINGYSNNYWGWGFEDDDLFYRCKLNEVPLDIKEVTTLENRKPVLKFNGHNAYIQGLFKPRDNSTVFVSFELQDLVLDHKKYDDEFVIFSIPKLNLKICYDSYRNYKVVFKDNEENLHYITTTRQDTSKTNLCITVNNGKITLYQEGKFIGEEIYSGFSNHIESSFYVDKTFKGVLYTLAIYDYALSKREVEEISNNKYYSLTTFDSSTYLKTYYETAYIKNYQLLDLSENKNKGKIVNCEMTITEEKTSRNIKIPFVRTSQFRELSHISNGYENGGWKDINTRYNQLRFYNEVNKGYHNTKDDGLNNCDYKIHSNTRVNNQTHLIVSI